MANPNDTRLPEKFRSKFVVNPDTDCWEWTAATEAAGYGLFSVNRKSCRAHRVAYAALRGPIPSGLVIDHLCRVHPCVNPDHMEVVTAKVNSLRGYGAPAINARKTHCKRNHEFTPENTGNRPSGGRYCKACNKARHERKKQEIGT